jgi:hypothetical protein
MKMLNFLVLGKNQEILDILKRIIEKMKAGKLNF